jgi:hypothetical protein
MTSTVSAVPSDVSASASASATGSSGGGGSASSSPLLFFVALGFVCPPVHCADSRAFSSLIYGTALARARLTVGSSSALNIAFDIPRGIDGANSTRKNSI